MLGYPLTSGPTRRTLRGYPTSEWGSATEERPMDRPPGAVYPYPFYLAVSATGERDGSVSYRILQQPGQGERISANLAGQAVPQCTHLTCRLANLGAAAVDWAYLLQLDSGPDEFHAEQMGFSLAPE